MSRISRRVRVAVILRSFLIQGSWNYRTLIGGGFAFSLLPALRRSYEDEPRLLEEAVERHTQVFNGHPYLVPLALGAVTALEARGESAALVNRFKDAIRGSLGTLGDRLVWVGWRPVCLLLALAALLMGIPWWVGIGGFLLVYNAGHLAMRIWGFRVGLRDPRRIGEELRRPKLDLIQRILTQTATFLVGLSLPLIVVWLLRGAGATSASSWSGYLWWVGCALGASLGIRLGVRLRIPVTLALVGCAIFGFVLGIFQ